MSTDWQAAEDAVLTAAQVATGLTAQWATQNDAIQPTGDYLAVSKPTGTTGSGLTEVRTTSTDMGQPAGEEVELRVSGMSEFTVRLQAFTAATTGTTCALGRLSNAGLRLRLESVRAALQAAGLVLVEVGAPRDLTAIAGTRWQGRASMELRFRQVQTEAERVGYIATAEVDTVLS